MDAVAAPFTLTAEETAVLSRLTAGSPPLGFRATAILSLAESGDLGRAAELSGLSTGQVRYWLGRFRSRRLGALGAAAVFAADVAAPQAPAGDAVEAPAKTAGKSSSKDKKQPAKKSAKSDPKAKKTAGKRDEKAKNAAAKGGKKSEKADKKQDKKPAKKKAAAKKAAKPAKRPTTDGKRKDGKRKKSKK